MHTLQDLESEAPPVDMAGAFASLALLPERLAIPGAVAPLVRAPRTGRSWRTKLALERTFAALTLLGTAPVFLLIALAIRLDSPGPVMFRQPRYGQGGRVFRIHKFRTMRHDLRDVSGGRQTAHADPRVTRVGRFLRRSSLDELPQLIDILQGEMNLIGPRAHPCGMQVEGALCEHVAPWYHQRHVVAPGLTGLAQISGSRGPVDTVAQLHRRLALDLDYIRDWSLRRDLGILLATVRVCLRGENAR